jgi:hypothetical protein
VLALIAQGRSNAAIAKELAVSERAIVNHVTRIYGKLRLPPGIDDHRRVLAVIKYLELHHTAPGDGVPGRAGLSGLDGCAAVGAAERAALGDGPPDGVDDEGESHFGDFPGGLNGSVDRALAGLGLKFGSHDFLLWSG